MKQVAISPDFSILTMTIKSQNQFDWSAMLSEVKALSGRTYNPQTRKWTAPNTPANIEYLKSHGWEVPGNTLPIAGTDEWKKVEVVSPTDALRPYQVDCLKFLTYRKGRALISDPCGAGKTAQACSYLKMNPDIRPALIVCTASTKLQWIKEWARWTGDDPIMALSGQTPKILRTDCNYVINWDILQYWLESVCNTPFSIVIGDEIQQIGNPKSLRTAAFKKIAKKVPKLIALSGTPIRSRPAQFYPLLNLLHPDVFNSHWGFLHRYCNPKRTPFGWTFKGATNIDELHRLINPLMLRREKSEIQKDLPPKNKIVIPIEISEADRKGYEDRMKEIFEEEIRDTLDRRDRMERLKYSAFHFKKEMAVKWINDFIDGGEKIVLFAYHRAVVDFLQEQFKKCCVKIDGSTPQSDRPGLIQSFQNDPRIQIMIGNIQAIGVGVDGLQNKCNNAAFLELPWAPSDLEQAEDRLHRMGQKESVNIYYLIAPGTIEDDIMTALDTKTSVFQQVIRGREAKDEDLMKWLLDKYTGNL